ncbi:MAG: hypothetical protein WCK63_03355 [Betaproteobacteria bacterium]
MKSLLFTFSLISALMLTPAVAQQGPAGVPGAPALAASIAPPPPSAPQAEPRKRAAKDCSQVKNPEQCKARVEARKQARAACKEAKAAERKQCVADILAAKK